MMLFSMMTAAQNGNAVSFMSRHFGFNHFQITHIIRQFIPQFMQGLETNFANKGGISSLLKVFDHKVFIQYYNDPDMYINPQVRYQGLEIMEKVFGSKEEQRSVINRVYLSTGVEIQNLQTLLPFISVLTLSSLYAKAQMALHPQFNKAPQIANHASSQGQQHYSANHNSSPLPQTTATEAKRHEMQHPIPKQQAPHSQETYYQEPPYKGNPYQGKQPQGTLPAHFQAQSHSSPQASTFQTSTSQAPVKRQTATLQHALTSREYTATDPHSGSKNQTAHFDIHNEPLPNIIVQAQEAYAKRMKRQQFHPKHWMRSQSQFPQSQFPQSQFPQSQAQFSQAHFAHAQQAKPSQSSHHAPASQAGQASQTPSQPYQNYQAPVAQQNRNTGHQPLPSATLNTHHTQSAQTGTGLAQASYGQMQVQQPQHFQSHAPEHYNNHYHNNASSYQAPVPQQIVGSRSQAYVQAASVQSQVQATSFRPAPRALPSRLETPGQRPAYGPHEVRPIHDNEPTSYALHDPIEFIESASHRPFQHRKYTSLREKLSSQLPWYDNF